MFAAMFELNASGRRSDFLDIVIFGNLTRPFGYDQV